MRQSTTMGALGRVATRTIVIIAAVIAVLIFSTAANLTATARGALPLKAVIIVGPTGSLTDEYLTWGETIAKTAENKGMTVARIYHPNALWSRVKKETTGANLVIYLGHGFGWPSPYPANLFESQMDGLGLNYPELDKRSIHQTHYYGADRIRESIRLAPNAIVILNHLCYSAGFGESGQAAPDQATAVKRVDNFASGFIAVGARTVFALAYQPAESIVKWLFTEHDTMEGLFKRRFNTWSSDSYGGWVGWNPTFHNSVRTPGAKILLDPHRTQSYRRAITGDLGFTTDEWKGSADPSDVTPPELTGLDALPEPGTLPAGEGAAPVFTPNNDGLSDKFVMTYAVSEDGYLDTVVRDSTDAVVRRSSVWTGGGAGTTTWNGKDDAGANVAEGRYVVNVTPRDVAGNVGLTASIPVKVIKAMKSPAGSPAFFYARDGDDLAASSTLTVQMDRDATLDWTIVDSTGTVVRTLMNREAVTVGPLARSWDGKDDAGAYVPNGLYFQVLTSTTEAGTYSHKLGLRLEAFKVSAPRWSGPAGTQVTFTMNSAETLSGWPTIYVYQPGLTKFRASPIKYTSKKFTFTVTFRSGGSPGPVQIKITGTDTGGGVQSQNVFFTLE